jgi:hypothetical protein
VRQVHLEELLTQPLDRGMSVRAAVSVEFLTGGDKNGDDLSC